MNPDTLSDRAILPLAKLLGEHADRIPETYEYAQEIAGGKAVTSTHTRAAVASILPPEPKPEPTRADLWRLIGEAVELADVLHVRSDLLNNLRLCRRIAHQEKGEAA